MPRVFEPLCATIVALSVAIAIARAPSRGRTAWRLALIAIGAWLGEDTLMRAHGAYSYAPSWSAFLDRMPLLVTCIWPVVVHSAWALARRLAPDAGPARRAALVGALVFTDAAFMEPIAVNAGLWTWTYAGPFGVPLVGVLGWAFFAAACILVLETCERRRAPWAAELTLLVIAPLAAHALTVASWWGLLRWIPETAPEPAVAAGTWVASLVACGLAARARADRALVVELSLRVPAAATFAWLLAVSETAAPLLAYALAFVPPYLVLLARGALGGGAPVSGGASSSPPRGTPSP